MTPFRENLRGILALTACNFLFLINDTLIKLARVELPLGEIVSLRGLLAAMVLVPLVIATGAHLRADGLFTWPLFWRTLAEIMSAYLYLIALFHIPISNANAILQVVPLAITAAAAIFFKDRVGWRRWVAIGIGFTGVLIVIRPGLAGFNAYSLLTLASVLFITVRDLTTRMMARGLPALLVALITAVAVALTGPAWGLLAAEEWVAPSPHALALVAGAVVFLIGGYLTAVVFMRHGDIAVVAPFRYVVVIWAMIVGFVVWGDVPDWPMLIGTAVIIGTGIYTFHRERRIAARQPAVAAAR